ncbi:MAG TPA: cation:proton antiporter [Tepidisphaeraceae bacterium]|jgi:Kef-type K+ transport system membrane component KefB|nr:cation:proton antiporter [Tepidisphaeraceae bacterium]
MVASEFILLLVVQTSLILALSRIMGFLFVRFRQPQVMGEMIAGIMLGPSLFGLLMPGIFKQVFPADSIQYLNALSQVGVIFFLFLIGLELDPKLMRNRGQAAVVISHASIITPFLMGTLLALFLYPRLFNDVPAMRFTSVALFLGASMSITAFPVLARILTERDLQRTQVGAVAITCAAVDDLTAWCMLAFVIAVARATGVGPALATAGKSIIYILVMFFVIRPFLWRLEMIFERRNRLSQNLLATILILVLASSIATEWIGIHALFGAFLMGAIMPKGTAFVRTLSEKLEDFTVVFLLPIFFAFTGLRTQIGLLNHGSLWLYTGLIIVAASAGKFGGSAVAARACGLSWRESSAIGVLMNTRGLMELVILNIGRDLGVITDAVFAMMVIMAIVTTALTTPILHLVHPKVKSEAEEAAARDQAEKRPFTVLIPISLPASGGPLANIAALLAPPPPLDAGRRIIALHLQRLTDTDPYSMRASQAPTQRSEALEPLLSAARGLDVPVEPIAFVSRDVPSDIARIARLRAADLILMGFHKPVFGQAILGGTVHRVMTASDSDVAVFVDRGLKSAKNILAPYLGGKHDRLALDLAGRIARNGNASLTILHVVPPHRSEGDAVLHARSAVEKTFSDPTQPTPVNFQVIEDASPVDALIQAAQQYDLVVVGVEEQWGMQSQLFGFRPERIARETTTSLLIVRKYTGPVVPGPTIPNAEPLTANT